MAQELQVRREARAEARIAREKVRAERATDQATRQAARRAQQRLQQAQKTAQIGKKRRLKASTKLALKKRVATQREVSGEASAATVALPPSQSRHGRSIKLPANIDSYIYRSRPLELNTRKYRDNSCRT
jgi:hypothetical protein